MKEIRPRLDSKVFLFNQIENGTILLSEIYSVQRQNVKISNSGLWKPLVGYSELGYQQDRNLKGSVLKVTYFIKKR